MTKYSKDPNKLKTLTSMQFDVTQKDATEPPFRNEFWNHKDAGLYVDVVSGEPLFSSLDKFDSHCGWPSFSLPLQKENVKERRDASHGMIRTEVRSKHGDSHLGHVFNDGPVNKGGLRYCINSASLRFVAVADLEKEGYGDYIYLFQDKKTKEASMITQTAILAGGCFWGMEDLLRKLPGVSKTEVGYIGGRTDDPTYKTLKGSGHAEAVKVEFDPNRLSYRSLLEFFFQIHDPSTTDRQGNDIGEQYRSAIFAQTEDQREIAEDVIRVVNASKRWPGTVKTKIERAGRFTRAEDFHQDYLEKNPGGYTCHWVRPNWTLTDNKKSGNG